MNIDQPASLRALLSFRRARSLVPKVQEQIREHAMTSIRIKKFTGADETRPFVAHGKLELLNFGDVGMGRGTFEPGWRWSKDVAPIAQTKSCQAAHTGYCLSGRMRVTLDSGESQEIGPGDAFTIAPGHDGEVLGDEPCVMVDFTGYQAYALPTGAMPQEGRGRQEGARPM